MSRFHACSRRRPSRRGILEYHRKLQRTLALVCGLLAVLPDPILAEQTLHHGLDQGPHRVGFQLIENLDHTRTVSGATPSKVAHPRPVRTYLWYPAEDSDGSVSMTFGRYAALADEDVWPSEITGAARDKLRFSQRALARSLGPELFAELLERRVFAVEHATAKDGPFPLIAMGQGLYYESPIAFAALAEYLASLGFVVATCPLVGTDSAFVRIDLQDLETQIRDLEFAIGRAREFSFVHQERLGVFGFDMGGMAGLVLTMRNPDVDAFVSVSSGILYEHPSGLPTSAPDYDPLSLRVPWLHSMPASWAARPPGSESKSLFDAAVHSDRYLLMTDDMEHVDYTSYALIEGRKPMRGYWAAPGPNAIGGHRSVSRYVSNFFGAVLRRDADGLAFLSRHTKAANEDLTGQLDHRPPQRPPLTYEEFVQAVLEGRAQGVINQVRALKASHPDHMLLQETYLQRLVWTLSNTWGLHGEALPVIRFWAELYPSSDGAQWMLAETYIDLEEYEAATGVYAELVERNPENAYLQSRLQSLQDQ